MSSKTSRKELLALDFEGVLKFFRVQLPKKYRMEENSKELLNTAVTIKVCYQVSIMIPGKLYSFNYQQSK